jgi:hypothetical protein
MAGKVDTDKERIVLLADLGKESLKVCDFKGARDESKSATCRFKLPGGRTSSALDIFLLFLLSKIDLSTFD